MGGRTSEIHLIDNAQFSVGDHQSEDDDDTDEDEEGQKYSRQVADDPGVGVASLLGLLSVAAYHLGSLDVHVGELKRSLERRKVNQLISEA